MNMNIIELLIALIINCVINDNSDQIKALPGFDGEPNFKQYSGYLNGGKDIKLFYWFVESQVNPSNDPVLLWLNGGPGESSLWGMFLENGPFRVASDGKTLTSDPNSWNALANVLYLESPVGVGYSYYTGNDTYRSDDNSTALMNRLALQEFFNKFPKFKTNSFYIAGESYGGHYVPMLALELLKNSPDVNLKGLAIGNGWVDSKLQESSSFEYAYYHGAFIDHKSWTQTTNTKCKCSESGQHCDFSDQADSLIFKFNYNGLSPYNLNDDVCSLMKYNESGHMMFHWKWQTLQTLSQRCAQDLFELTRDQKGLERT